MCPRRMRNSGEAGCGVLSLKTLIVASNPAIAANATLTKRNRLMPTQLPQCFACGSSLPEHGSLLLFCTPCTVDLKSHPDEEPSRLDIEVEVQAMFDDEQLRKGFPL
jgi:hypothetical protein